MLFARAQPASVVCTDSHCKTTKCCHWGLCGGFALAGAYVDKSHADHFEHNICVQGVESAYPAYIMESSGCPETKDVGVLPVLSHNRVYNSFNFTGALCGARDGDLVDVASWRSGGFDLGSTTNPLPTSAQIILWIEQMLSIPHLDTQLAALSVL